MIPTVFTDEQLLLKSILDLHNKSNSIDLDPMYGRGHLYLEIPKPRICSDIVIQDSGVLLADARCLPLPDNSISSTLLDPPFCFGVHGKVRQNISARRFSVLDSFESLVNLYQNIIQESYRILIIGGILIFKCQDYTDSRTTMTHCLVYNWATNIGFYAKDLAILVNRSRIYNPNLKQRHMRKTHCYYWVFQRTNRRY